MKKNTAYRPVKGSRQYDFFGGFSSLWLSDDHLLLVRRNNWKEFYRKFYFRDIQALILAETKQRRNHSVIFLLMILFFLVLAGMSQEIGRIIHLSIAFATLLVLLIDWFKGPTCTARIITAVQTTSLPYKRLPPAERLQKELNTAVEKVQGHFDTEHGERLDCRLQEISTADKQRSTAADRAKQTAGSEEFTLSFDNPFDNRFHLISFFLFLLLAGISVLSLGGRGQLLYTLETLLFAITLITIIIALYHQSRSGIRGMTANLTWVAAIWLVLAAVANFGLIFEAMTQEEAVRAMLNKEYGVWMLLGQVQPADSLYLRVLLIARTIGFTLLGSTGLWFSSKAGKAQSDG